jgi:hypothetical protein
MKVAESCFFKSWFMLGLTVRTAMLGLDPLHLASGLLKTPHPTPTDKETVVNLYLPGWMPRTVEQTVT